MKYIILALAMASCTINIFAQKIELNKIENGERTIMCSHESVRSMKDKVVFSVALCVNQNKAGENFYNLSLKTTALNPISVSNGGKLLVKLIDGSVLELSTIKEYAGTVRDVHNINGYVFSDYTIFPTFLLTTKQVEQIAKGVKKIRLETTEGPVDKEFKKDKIGEIIATEYSLIKTALTQQKSFSDGF